MWCTQIMIDSCIYVCVCVCMYVYSVTCLMRSPLGQTIHACLHKWLHCRVLINLIYSIIFSLVFLYIALLPPCPLCVADVRCSREASPFLQIHFHVCLICQDRLSAECTRVLLLLLQRLLSFSYQTFLLCFALGRHRRSFSYISTSV